MTVKRIIGAGFKIAIALTVLAFLGMKSLDFFTFTTPADESYYAWLGFGLTGGGVIAYLIIFLWDADTALKKAIAITMLAVCVIGELATAGFGLQINAWQKEGVQLTQEAFDAMVFAVQLLGFAHAMALIGYVAGDAIIYAFQDDDGDGTANIFDPVDNRTGKKTGGILSIFKKNRQPASVPAPLSAETEQPSLTESKNGHGTPDPTRAAR